MNIAQKLSLDILSGVNDFAEVLLKEYFAEAQELLIGVSEKMDSVSKSQLDLFTSLLKQDTDISSIGADFLLENADS